MYFMQVKNKLIQSIFTTFRKRICDAKTRGVYCCDDDQMPPSDNELKILKDANAYQTTTSAITTTSAPATIIAPTTTLTTTTAPTMKSTCTAYTKRLSFRNDLQFML